jgi:hypothetical protein
MKAKGLTARTGTVVQYIFCLAQGEESTKTAQADRAKHPEEIKRSEGQLKIGKTRSVSMLEGRFANTVNNRLRILPCEPDPPSH